MVVKQVELLVLMLVKFESSVISYGSETICIEKTPPNLFESSVISYGSETMLAPDKCLQ